MKSPFITSRFINTLSPGCFWILICLLLAACTPISPLCASEFDIIIHEIMYHPSESNLCGEFVEIYNRGTTAVDVSGWQLIDEQQVMYTLPPNTIINGGGYLVFFNDAQAVDYNTPRKLGAEMR